MRQAGFTLAELLIALAILGVIATFTIPKVLNSQQSGEWNASAKEVAGMLSGALAAERQQNGINASTGTVDLTPYFNYVKIDTHTIDSQQGQGSWPCGFGTIRCLRMHSGGVLLYMNDHTFSGTSNLNAISFMYDPDGVYSGSTTGNGKGIWFILYTNGRLTTNENVLPGTTDSNGAINPSGFGDAPWFSWN